MDRDVKLFHWRVIDHLITRVSPGPMLTVTPIT